jgi:hypothetical protein
VNAPGLLEPSYTRHPDAHRRIAPEDLTVVARDSAEYLSVQFVRRTVAGWGLTHLAGSPESVVSQLVTRAVELTGKPSPPPRIGVRLTLIRPGLLVEVWDSNPTSPLPAEGEYLDEHLSVVQEICDKQQWQRWNWHRAPYGGKVIWVELHHRHYSTEPMPRRTAGEHSYPEPDPPIAFCDDVPAMRRTLDGLHQLDTQEGNRGQF